MISLPPRPIPASYWVRPGQLLAGEYPGTRDDAQTRHRVQGLLEAGVSFFLDLTEVGEAHLKPYYPFVQFEAMRHNREVQYLRMPLRDMDVTTPIRMTRILDTIDGALAAGHVLYVHCWGGTGRTGTVIGSYLVRHGLDSATAQQQVAHLRHRTLDNGQHAAATGEPQQPLQK